jgi:hypothetical protein
VDGMYAPCQGSDGERYYFAAWTEVEKVWALPSTKQTDASVFNGSLI